MTVSTDRLSGLERWNKLKETISVVQPMMGPVGGIMYYRPRYEAVDNSEQLRLFDEHWG